MESLKETTIQKMAKEREFNRYIDNKIACLSEEFKYSASEIIDLIKEIRAYREKIFKLKCKLKDINKYYDRLKISDDIKEVTFFKNIKINDREGFIEK